MGTQTLIDVVTQVQNGVAEESKQVEQHQDHREILFAVTKVVFQMIAIVLEDIVVLVLDFPARTTSRDNGGDVVVAEGVIGGKGIVIETLACLLLDNCHFTPVDLTSVGVSTQGNLI